MKKFFSSLLIIAAFATLTLYSCSNDTENNTSPTNNESISFEGMQIKAMPSGAIVLMEYATVEELYAEVDAKIVMLLEDSLREIEDLSDADNITTKINFSNGKAVITEVIYTDSKTDTVIRAYELVENEYVATSLPGPISAYVGACPSGYKEIANCSNLSEPQECVENAVSTYMTSNLKAVGNCVDVRVSIGAFNTKVCGKKC
ncbi:hypothetical protein [Flavobacterium coralii]|uniref:hypothetical protein n=1 Tax=Flavobacterium coralii TaxID=2838017 RepID=UPI000C4FAC40|nr:hypothetical protein [Flavobacterium sp.]|tara:strand:- start:44291 stop:44899 length:609 start_codon:yes stop_codon:yes gene_type:complete